MLLGIDLLGLNQGAIFNTTNFLGSYYNVQMENSLVDDVYVSQDTTVSNSTTKPTTWGSKDVLYCPFNSTLEGGSISGSGQYITSVAIQKRDTSGLTWDTVTSISYVQGQTSLVNFKDYYVQNGTSYEYILVPMINDVQGLSAPANSTIKVDFDSMFLTDATYNYQLQFDPKLDNLSYNVSSATFEPLNSQYPIVQYQTLNYRTQNITTTLYSPQDFENCIIDVGNEKLYRDNIAAFLTNRKPKLFRNLQGDIILCVITGKPTIGYPTNRGIVSCTFSITEVGGTDYNTLKQFGVNR